MRTIAQELREHREAMLRARQARLAGVQGFAGGRIGSAAPNLRSRRAFTDKPQPMPEPLTSGGQAHGFGQLLVLSATDAEIPAGGGYVAFDSIVTQLHFPGVVAAGSAWAHPISGVYILTYEHEWDGFNDGGEIYLELAGVPAPGGEIAAGEAGAAGAGTIHYYAGQGELGRIKIDHGSESAQVCNAVMHLSVPDPDAPVEMWLAVFSGTVRDLVRVDNEWWTTQGASGLTVSRRSASGTVLSTFDADEVGGVSSRVRGITFDGTDLWVMGDDEALGRYSTAGEHLQTIDLESSWGSEGTGRGVTFDGTDLWAVGDVTKELRRYSTAGSHEQTIDLPPGSNYDSVAYYDGNLYVVDITNNQLIVVDPATGDVVGSVDVSGAASSPNGVWISDDGEIYVSKESDGVYRRRETI